NGKFLVTAGNSVWQMWDMTRKRVVQGGAFNIHAHDMPVACSPDNRTVGVAGDKSTRLWAGKNGPTLPGHTDELRALAYSPAGNLLASVGEDGRLILWEVAGGKRKLTRDLPGKLTSVSFPVLSADARPAPDQFLACGNQNGSILVLQMGFSPDEA